MFQKIKDFFNLGKSSGESKSLKNLMISLGYNKDLLNNIPEDDFEKTLEKKFTASLLTSKRLLIEQENKDIWRAFQLANAQQIHNVCFINFIPENSNGFFLKSQKNKKKALTLRSFDEAKDLSECVFVSFGNFSIENSVKVGRNIASDYQFLWNTSLSEISDIEKIISSGKVAGFSASKSIFDGSRFGFKKIFADRKYKIKSAQTLSEQQIREDIARGKFNFVHLQSIFYMFDNSSIASIAKKMNQNISQFSEISKSIKSMINSMTIKERKNPSLLNSNSRIERIAKGCGQKLEPTREFIRKSVSMLQELQKPEIIRRIMESGIDPLTMMNPSQWMNANKKN